MRALKPEWSYLKLCSTEAWLTDVGADPSLGVPHDEAKLRPYLAEIATYADIVSPHKSSLVADPSKPPASSDFIETAHAA